MLYQAKKIILENKVIEDGYLEVQDGRFGLVSRSRPAGETINRDFADCIISPGLVDTHIHGYQAYDVMDNDLEGLKAISKRLLECGVTSWLPTTLTDQVEKLSKVCQLIGKNHQKVEGAVIQGIFLEGPFFTQAHSGAQNPKYMLDPSKEIFDHWQEVSNHLIKKIAIAPERRKAKEFINYVASQGVSLALAHSSASYEEAIGAIQAGASIFVHTYNGMSGLLHRDPGMVGAALNAGHAYAEIICDGHHVHPAAISILTKSRGFEETILVSDCMRAGGLADGKSSLGEYEVNVKDGKATLAGQGNLAGSILKLIDGVQNIVHWGIAPVEDALRMASLYPARSVGIDKQCGKIESKRPADFIVVDEKANLKATFLQGEQVYRS